MMISVYLRQYITYLTARQELITPPLGGPPFGGDLGGDLGGSPFRQVPFLLLFGGYGGIQNTLPPPPHPMGALGGLWGAWGNNLEVIRNSVPELRGAHMNPCFYDRS